MIEILVMLVPLFVWATLILGFGKDNKGVIITEKRNQALLTLGQNTGLILGTKIAILERFRMLKSQVTFTFRGVTATEGAGYLLFLADGDLTLTEIELAIESTGPVGPNDRPAIAIAERPVFLVGATVGPQGFQSVEMMALDMISNAPVCIVKPRWTFARTKSWNWVLYNNGQAPTTGSTVEVQAKNFGVWVT